MAKKSKITKPAEPDTVRVYVVKTSLLQYQYSPTHEYRKEGELVSSAEFVPPTGVSIDDLETRYVETGALELKETLSRAEWDARQG